MPANRSKRNYCRWTDSFLCGTKVEAWLYFRISPLPSRLWSVAYKRAAVIQISDGYCDSDRCSAASVLCATCWQAKMELRLYYDRLTVKDFGQRPLSGSMDLVTIVTFTFR